MTIETKHYATCDRCDEKEVSPNPNEAPLSWALVELTYRPVASTEQQTVDWDLCAGCKQELLRWLKYKPRDMPA